MLCWQIYSAQEWTSFVVVICYPRPSCFHLIEQLVVDRINKYILAEGNLEELVKLTNEELCRRGRRLGWLCIQGLVPG